MKNEIGDRPRRRRCESQSQNGKRLNRIAQKSQTAPLIGMAGLDAEIKT